ncbi:MAG: hypothetical protein H7Y88_00515 [Phycisphaerales bacterium]|nr:hypothetical protein [Phycisphaerales bacterium]
MPNTTSHLFLKAVRGWVEATESRDLIRTRFYLDEIRAFIKLSLSDPFFLVELEKKGVNCDGDSAKLVLDCLQGYFAAVTDRTLEE